MCLDRAAFVGVLTYRRLVSQGVNPDRAEGVARKVARAYRLKAAAERQSAKHHARL